MNNLELPKLDIITLDDFNQKQDDPVSQNRGQKAFFTRSASGLYVPVSLTKDKPL